MSIKDDVQQQEQDSLDKVTVKNKDFIAESRKQYDAFNANSWKKGLGWRMSPGAFPNFDAKMEGLESGLFLFAAEPNIGKSALLLELALQYAANPDNKLFCLYISLDDTVDKLIPRLLASHASLAIGDNTGAPIDLFSKPSRYVEKLETADPDSDMARIYYSYLYEDISLGGAINPDYIGVKPESLEQFPDSVRTKAYKWLHSTEDYFMIVDGTTVSNGEQLIDCCKKVQQYVREVMADPEYNIIVAIDSLSDIQWENKRLNNDKELNDYTSKKIKQLAVEELKCAIFGSIHLRKIDQKKRPTIADVKESGRWAYEANVVFVLHNDVARNGEMAAICGRDLDDPEGFKLPVIEIRWAKNKQSSFKGYTFCYFKTNFSKVWEVTEESDITRFTGLLYST